MKSPRPLTRSRRPSGEAAEACTGHAQGMRLMWGIGGVARSLADAPTLPPCSDIARFGKMAKLTAFKPFTSAADALEQINAVSESQLTDALKNFLELNLPKVRTWRLHAPAPPGQPINPAARMHALHSLQQAKHEATGS